MITKVFLELTNGRTYNIDAEIEETKMGYKITLPDGSGAEIRRDMIKRIEMEKESAQIIAVGEVEPHIMPKSAPHYNIIEPKKMKNLDKMLDFILP